MDDVDMHEADIHVDGDHAKDTKAVTIGGETVMPWVEKYRPQCLSDLVAHTDIISTIQSFVDKNQLPHLLFHGPPGTGKTSTILACAKGMHGKRYGSMVLELNASDARGIDVVREQIRSFVSARQLFSTGVKLVVLDEADNMTSAAQFALRRIMEQYSSNARFCLICNYVNKIIPALQSRCTKFRFGPLSDSEVRGRVQHVAHNEGAVTLSPDGLEALVKLGRGDMRKVLNIFQSAAMAFDQVNEEAVFLTTGTPLPSDIRIIFDLLASSSVDEAFTSIDRVCKTKGYAMADILYGLHELIVRVRWPAEANMLLMPRLADIEYRLSLGCAEKVQLGALVGAFQEIRGWIDSAKAKSQGRQRGEGEREMEMN